MKFWDFLCDVIKADKHKKIQKTGVSKTCWALVNVLSIVIVLGVVASVAICGAWLLFWGIFNYPSIVIPIIAIILLALLAKMLLKNYRVWKEYNFKQNHNVDEHYEAYYNKF